MEERPKCGQPWCSRKRERKMRKKEREEGFNKIWKTLFGKHCLRPTARNYFLAKTL